MVTLMLLGSVSMVLGDNAAFAFKWRFWKSVNLHFPTAEA